MAVITKITTQQKNQARYNVYLDHGKGEEFAFSVDEDVLIKFQLKKGLELDDFSLMEIHYQDDIRKSYNSAVAYLAKRMRSVKEVRDFLLKKEIEDPVIHEVIHKLVQQKYLEDQEYAFAYVRSQINTTDKGPDLIQLELKDKGIEKSMIEIALKEYSDDQQFEKAAKLCEKFVQKNTKDSNKVIKKKMENMLLRKGYSFDIIHKAVNETESHKPFDEELDAISCQYEKIHRKFSHLSGFEYDQKIKQALYRKGFSIEVIEIFLAKQKEID